MGHRWHTRVLVVHLSLSFPFAFAFPLPLSLPLFSTGGKDRRDVDHGALTGTRSGVEIYNLRGQRRI